jgi:hypothetical protein
MKSVLSLALLVPFIAHAQNEATVSCDLAKAQAKLLAAELAYPSLYISGGDQINQKTVAVGLSQSVSGLIRAKNINKAADAQCDAFQSSVLLNQYKTWATLDIQKRAAIASLKELDSALRLSNENVNILKAQLEQNIVTINEIELSIQSYHAIEDYRAAMLSLASVSIPSMEFNDIGELINSYKTNQAKAAKLTAKAQAHSGWDFVIAAGENKSIDSQYNTQSSTTKPFFTATIKYSFGTHAAMKAADEIGKDTSLLLSVQQDGFFQHYERSKKEIQSMIEIEKINVQTSNKELSTLNLIRIPLENVNTTLAANARRTLDIQLMSIKATLIGANVRLAGYKELFEKMNGNW